MTVAARRRSERAVELLLRSLQAEEDVERKLWELLCANVLILALIILAAIVSGWGEALAWLGGLLATDVRIVSRWVRACGGNGRWRDDGRSGGGRT